MNRKMKARIANAQAKATRIRRERQQSNPNDCDSCGHPWDDHRLGITEEGNLAILTPVKKSKLN